jgi:hypothetical protein
MTAPDHMFEMLTNACINRGIHTWSLRQTRCGSLIHVSAMGGAAARVSAVTALTAQDP